MRGLTHASVTELELQFAQNPRSDAYIALCEAYLSQGRFMEAMVVSKKGIKAHPEAVEAKLLLARVYAAQKKFPRALQTLAAAMASHPEDPRVYVLRAQVKLDSTDQAGAIQDLKRALELDPAHEAARAHLVALGVPVPHVPGAGTRSRDASGASAVPAPRHASQRPTVAARPDLQSVTGDLLSEPVRLPPGRDVSSDSLLPGEIEAGLITGDFRTSDLLTGDISNSSTDLIAADTVPFQNQPGQGPTAAPRAASERFAFGGAPGERLTFGEPANADPGGLTFSDAPRNEFDFEGIFGESAGIGGPPKAPSGSFAATQGQERAPSGIALPPMQVMPQKLEGEDELEKMARSVAEQKENRGRPRTTVFLIVVLALLGTGVIVQRILHKNRIEAIDRLTTEALPAFNRDTYGGYKRAAASFEDILKDYDPKHPLTLGRLAHTYAILWSEHGEPVKDRLDEVLALAEKEASGISHTVAAQGLALLYGTKDHREGAKSAYEAVEPMVHRTAKGGAAPTHADLTLGIIELDLGEYEQAEKRLNRVKQVLPGSVRAQVWHAQAAFRARRLGTALRAYRAASRSEPNHAGALAGQALTHLERGDLARATEALQRFDQLQRTNPKDVSTRDSALAVYARSALLRADGQDGKANGLYEEAVRADPRNADFSFGLGRWLLQNDRAQEALVPLEQAVAMEPTRYAFHIEIAEAEMMVGQWEQAKVNIDEAIKLAPDKAEVALAKARWMRRRRQPGTESYLQALLKKHPSARLGINLELGRLYRAQKKFRRAEAALEAALAELEGYPKVVQADVLISYGRLMLDRRRAETALNSFREAAKRGAPEGYYRIAYAQYGGNSEAKAEAKRACDKLMAAGSSSGYARKARALCETL